MICSYFPVTNLFNNPELCSDMFDIQPYAIGMLLLGVPSCEQYPSQPLFPNLWGSNIHWVGLGVTGNNGGFSHEKKGVLWFFPSNPLKYQWSVPLERSHCVSVKIPQGSTGVAVPFDRKRVVAFKCLKKVIYIYIIYYIYQNDLLLAMDMAKVGDPLPVVKVCTSMLCVKIGYR